MYSKIYRRNLPAETNELILNENLVNSKRQILNNSSTIDMNYNKLIRNTSKSGSLDFNNINNDPLLLLNENNSSNSNLNNLNKHSRDMYKFNTTLNNLNASTLSVKPHATARRRISNLAKLKMFKNLDFLDDLRIKMNEHEVEQETEQLFMKIRIDETICTFFVLVSIFCSIFSRDYCYYREVYFDQKETNFVKKNKCEKIEETPLLIALVTCSISNFCFSKFFIKSKFFHSHCMPL
jgi:hypothetical protein